MTPVPELVSVKFAIVFAPLKVKPVAETVTRLTPLIKPAPLSLKVPVLVRLTLLLPASIEPVMIKLPVLLRVKLPLPLCVMPVTVKG